MKAALLIIEQGCFVMYKRTGIVYIGSLLFFLRVY